MPAGVRATTLRRRPAGSCRRCTSPRAWSSSIRSTIAVWSTPARQLSFGIKTSQQGATYTEIQRVWREADQLPVLEHAWLWDHLVPLRGDITGAALEAWTLLSALAAQTSRLRLGVIVTSNRLRSPTLLAKMAATVDVIAGGRLDFGIGAGGTS
ncbi:MAG: LLM class flavin-dependent oxidoreductase, partial [Streptosporangiaceae bacterium]